MGLYDDLPRESHAASAAKAQDAASDKKMPARPAWTSRPFANQQVKRNATSKAHQLAILKAKAKARMSALGMNAAGSGHDAKTAVIRNPNASLFAYDQENDHSDDDDTEKPQSEGVTLPGPQPETEIVIRDEYSPAVPNDYVFERQQMEERAKERAIQNRIRTQQQEMETMMRQEMAEREAKQRDQYETRQAQRQVEIEALQSKATVASGAGLGTGAGLGAGSTGGLGISGEEAYLRRMRMSQGGAGQQAAATTAATTGSAAPGGSGSTQAMTGEEAYLQRMRMSQGRAAPAPVSAPVPSNPHGKGQGESFAAKLMSKMGWKEGQGLGKNEQGRSQALAMARDQSLVILLENMVGPGEVDHELEPEIVEECEKYGPTERCLIYECPPGQVPPEKAVRIFVKFKKQGSAASAIKQLNGRVFGGRNIAATYFEEAKFTRLELAPF